MSPLQWFTRPPDVEQLLAQRDVAGLCQALSYRRSSNSHLTDINPSLFRLRGVRADEKGAAVRQAAAEALGKLRDAAGVPALAEALEDEDRRVAAASVSALGAIGSPGAVEALTRAVATGNREAAVVLARRKVAVAELNPALFSEVLKEVVFIHSPACEMAVGWLESVGDTRAFYPLLDALEQVGRELDGITLGRLPRDAKARWEKLEERLIHAARTCYPPELKAEDVPQKHRDAFGTIKNRLPLWFPHGDPSRRRPLPDRHP